MSTILFKNFPEGTLASTISAIDTSITLTAGQGALFPDPGTDECFYCVIEDASYNREIVKVTSRTGDVFDVVVRGQEVSLGGFAAREWPAGTWIGLRLTAETMNSLNQGDSDTSELNNIYFVSTSADITDHADDTQEGSYAYIIANSIGANYRVIVFPPKTTSYPFLTDYVSVPKNVHTVVMNGAVLESTNDISLIFIGKFSCGNSQCFTDNTSTGDWIKFYEEATEYINPAWWGAKAGFDFEDASPAINLAFECARTLLNGANYRAIIPVRFFPGRYQVNSSCFAGTTVEDWDANTASYHVKKIEGYGATLFGSCTGDPVLDYTGAFDFEISGLSIYGDSLNIPSIGILQARLDFDSDGEGGSPGAGLGKFKDIDIRGYFSVSALYNYTSESCDYTGCSFQNEEPAGGADYAGCAIVSRDNTCGVTSPNTTIAGTAATNAEQSTSNIAFRHCRFDHRAASADPDLDAGLVLVGARSILVDDCYFNSISDQHYAIILAESGLLSDPLGITITNNLFHGSIYGGVYVKTGTTKRLTMMDNKSGTTSQTILVLGSAGVEAHVTYLTFRNNGPDCAIDANQSGCSIEDSDISTDSFVTISDEFTGVIVGNRRCGINLTGRTYEWTESGSGTDEWYCQLADAGGDPGLNEPYEVRETGVGTLTPGTVGSLAAAEWDYGDNDTLGYNTIYVRLGASGDPNDAIAAEDYNYLKAWYRAINLLSPELVQGRVEYIDTGEIIHYGPVAESADAAGDTLWESQTVVEGTSFTMIATVHGYDATSANSISACLWGHVSFPNGGALAMNGTGDLYTQDLVDDGATGSMAVALDVSGGVARVRVTGEAALAMVWRAKVDIIGNITG